jgi:hypothetical protein
MASVGVGGFMLYGFLVHVSKDDVISFLCPVEMDFAELSDNDSDIESV